LLQDITARHPRPDSPYLRSKGLMAGGIFPWLGVVLSNLLYLTPAPAVYAAAQKRSIGSLNVLPQALMVISTFSWVCYSLSVPDPFITAANLPGCLASLWYVVTLLPLIPREAAADRRLVQIVIIGGAGALLSLCTFLIFSKAKSSERSFALGIFGSVLCVILFASPLSTMREVLATWNAASIYAPLTVATCVNCASWTAYGLVVDDIWVYLPNGTGLCLGLIQLALKMRIPSSPKPDEASSRLVTAGKASCSDDEPSD